MKILVLQLARLGDIYLTWPALRGLKRKYPEAEIHLMTRPLFESATVGLEVVDRYVSLPTRKIFESVINEDLNLNAAIDEIGNFLDPLVQEKYDKIINLSYSVVSSYITYYLTHEHTEVVGYTRTSDGYLAIPDDMSAYFYAQVGVGRANRIHLSEVFALTCGVELTPDDWAPPRYVSHDKGLPHDYVVVHVAASDPSKSFSPHKWSAVINHFHKHIQVPVLLVGGANERKVAEAIRASCHDQLVIDLVGGTNLQQLFVILKKALMVVGGDSAPMHMASFLNVPCVNISFSNVNFWETGPLSNLAWILRAETEADLGSDFVAGCMLNFLQILVDGEGVVAAPDGVIVRQNGNPAYRAPDDDKADFQWFLLTGLYMSEAFPAPVDDNFIPALAKIEDVNNLMLEQFEKIADSGQVSNHAGIIERADEIIETIAGIAPSTSPLVRWYQTEKLRLGPMGAKQLLEKTIEIHLLLGRVIRIYLDNVNSAQVDSEVVSG